MKLSSSGPCETLRAHLIPGENPEGKSRGLPWMFSFLLQISDSRDLLHFRLYYIYIYKCIAFAYIIIYSVIYSTNTILTITKLINTSNKVRWDVKDKLACYGTKELSEKKNVACHRNKALPR